MNFTPIKTNPIRLNVLALLALGAVSVLLLLAAPSRSYAAEATAGDSVTIPLGAAKKGLRIKSARVTAVSPAKIRGATIVLPVSAVTVPLLTEGTLVLRGGFTVKAGIRKVVVQGLFITIRGGKLTVTAKVGSRRLTIFTGASAGSLIDAATTSVTARASKLALTKAAAKYLNKALASRGFKSASIGKLSGSAKGFFAPSTTPPPSGTPSSNFNWTEPTPLTEPSGSVAILTASPLTVWPRVSFINYLRQGGGNSSAELPADDDDAINPGDHICVDPLDSAPASAGVFSFSMPFTDGWWHAASNKGALHYSGLIRFSYPDHGINIAFASAEVEFNGASSRVIYRVTDPDNLAGKRGDVVSLPELASTNPVSNGTPTEYAAKITTVGNQALGGLYATGGPFGCIQLDFNG